MARAGAAGPQEEDVLALAGLVLAFKACKAPSQSVL